MRKFLFGWAVLCLLASCNNATTGSADDEAAKKNLEANRMVLSAFETGDVSKIDSAIADDFVDHTDRGDMKGRDSLKAMVKYVKANFKDMKATVVKELADKEYVFSWIKYTGTGDGVIMPAGPYEMNTMEVSRFRDGKAVEHWAFMEHREAMKMVTQMSAGQQKVDTTGQ